MVARARSRPRFRFISLGNRAAVSKKGGERRPLRGTLMISILEVSNPSISRLVHQHGGGRGGGAAFSKCSNYRVAISPAALRGRNTREFISLDRPSRRKKREPARRCSIPNCTRGDDAGARVAFRSRFRTFEIPRRHASPGRHAV